MIKKLLFPVLSLFVVTFAAVFFSPNLFAVEESPSGINSCEDIYTASDLFVYLGIHGSVDFDCFSQAVVEVVNQPVVFFPGDKIEDYIQVSIDGSVKPLSQIDGQVNFVAHEASLASITVFTPHNLPNWVGSEEPKKEHTITIDILFYETCEEILGSASVLSLYLAHYNEDSLDCTVPSPEISYTQNVSLPQGGDLIDYVEIYIDGVLISTDDLTSFMILDESFTGDEIGTFTVSVALAYPDATSVLAEFVVTVESASIENARISPIFECVIPQENGTYLAHFGYENHNTVVIDVLVGDDNKVSGGGLEGIDQGQVTRFLYPAPNHPEDRPGRTGFYPDFAFNVEFDGSALVWTLRGPDGQARTATASSQGAMCPDIDTESEDDENENENNENENNNNTSSGGGGGSSSTLVGGSQSSSFSSGGGEVLGDFTQGEVLGESTIDCPVFYEFHRRGDRGGQVYMIQEFLNSYFQSGLAVDGIFGPLTEQAVHNFQQTYWQQIIEPWTPALSGRTTGWWYKTTSAWANTLSGCISEPVFLEDTGKMHTPEAL